MTPSTRWTERTPIGYALDNAWQEARRRLALLEASLDPATQRRMTALGVGQGWRCIDTRFLDPLTAPNLEVRQHNLVTDPLPVATFDLVHTRLVLMHLAEREQILPRLVAVLKPGGWLLLEEHDNFSLDAIASGPYAATWAAATRAIGARGARADWARELPGRLVVQGLVEVAAEGDVPIFAGGSPMAQFWLLTWEQLRDAMLMAGAREPDLAAARALLADPQQWLFGPAMIVAWGRRPSA
jgi:SAM-dependent methyltransferase